MPSLDPLIHGRSIQQDLDGTPDQLMLGALLEIRRAAWAPVGTRGRLRGIVLAGTRRKHGVLPLARIEAVSAELALAIELEEERRLARQRQADLTVNSRLLSELTGGGLENSVFMRLVDACTETAPGGDGLGAVFAILRMRRDPHASANHAPNGRSSFSTRNHAASDLAPCWQSGEAVWLHAMDAAQLASIWQRAEEARDTIVITSGSGLAWPRADVARIVAIPLFSAREPIGTLVAGLRPGHQRPAC